MKDRMNQIEELMGSRMLRIISSLTLKQEILLDEFEALFKYLDELSDLAKGRDVIPKSLAYKLFHCYVEVSKQFASLSDSEMKRSIQSRLLRDIIVILHERE